MDGSYGILGTSVAWVEIETNLREALSTKAKFGPNKDVRNIGDGLMSGCGLITCDWIDVGAEEKLPEKVIIKITSLDVLRKANETLPNDKKVLDFSKEQWNMMEQQITMIHNTEVASYDYLSQFKGCSVPTRFYGSAYGAGGQLCLSYMDNSRAMQFYERHTVGQVQQIARALGKIQAYSLQKEVSAPELQMDMFIMFKELFSLETYRGMANAILALDTTEKTRALMEKVDALICIYHGSNVPTSIHKQMGLRPVLVNGDLHAGNVLIDKDTGELRALIDWQGAHLGVGVEDLHRIAMSALTAEERRANMPMLTKEMYDSMVANLHGDEPPYTMEMLLHVSDIIYPQCALFLAVPFISFMTQNEKDVSLTDDDKASRMEVMLDKVIGIFEDAVEIDTKNNNNNNGKGDLQLVYE